MSGPKVTVYTLTPEQIALIEARRKKEQEEKLRKKMLLLQGEDLVKELQQIKKSVLSYEFIAEKSKVHLNHDELSNMVMNSLKACDDVSKKLNKLEKIPVNDELQKVLDNIKNQVKTLKMQLPKLNKLASEEQNQLQETLTLQIIGLFDTIPDDMENESNNAIDKIYDEIKSFKENEILPISFKEEIEVLLNRGEEIKNKKFLQTFIAVEVQPLFDKCKDYLSLWESIGREYQLLLFQYESLLEQNQELNNAEIIPFSSDAIARLESAIAVQEAKAQEYEEQEYIAKTLNEVMEEMGYKVLGNREVTKRNGKHFRNELYQYGNDTAIDVLYDDNGQITLELGKMDNCDRIPTDFESEILENKMAEFCKDFAEFEGQLKKRGISIGNRVFMAPPSAEFARVINTEDYELVKELEFADKKRKQTEKQLKSINNE